MTTKARSRTKRSSAPSQVIANAVPWPDDRASNQQYVVGLKARDWPVATAEDLESPGDRLIRELLEHARRRAAYWQAIIAALEASNQAQTNRKGK
jgi:hypothetical protein